MRRWILLALVGCSKPPPLPPVVQEACPQVLAQATVAAVTGDSVFRVEPFAYTPPHLRPGEGVALVESYCGVCHSPGYVAAQPKFSGEAWGKLVKKMIEKYGAIVPEADAAKIVGYLQTNY